MASMLDEQWPGYVCEVKTREWHEARFRHVTGTALAALAGLHEYQNKDSLAATWHLRREDTNKQSRAMWWGDICEDPNRRALSRILSPAYAVHKRSAFFAKWPIGASLDGYGVRTSLELPWAEDNASLVTSAPKRMLNELAHLEMSVLEGGSFLVEMKQSDLPRKKWGPTAPPHYWAQCQAQMYVTGIDVCLLVAKLGAAEMRLYTIESDADFMAEAVAKAKAFLEEMGLANQQS